MDFLIFNTVYQNLVCETFKNLNVEMISISAMLYINDDSPIILKNLFGE